MKTGTFAQIGEALETLVKLGLTRTQNANLAPFSIIDAGDEIILGLTFDDFTGGDIRGAKLEEPGENDRGIIACWIDSWLVEQGIATAVFRDRGGVELELYRGGRLVAREAKPLGDALDAIAPAAFKALGPEQP